MLRRTVKLCVFCGNREGKTKDHVPPKSIFPSPRPNDLITVPACRRCNEEYGKIEERFRVYLSIRVGSATDLTRKFWKETLRTLGKSRKLHRQIIQSITKASVYTPGDIYLGDRVIGPWPVEYHDPIIEKITKGLYFHHFREILDPRVSIKVFWCKTIEDIYNYRRILNGDLQNLWAELPAKAFSGFGAFRYSYGFSEERLYTVWIYDFYGGHFAAAFSCPPGHQVELEENGEEATSA